MSSQIGPGWPTPGAPSTLTCKSVNDKTFPSRRNWAKIKGKGPSWWPSTCPPTQGGPPCPTGTSGREQLNKQGVLGCGPSPRAGVGGTEEGTGGRTGSTRKAEQTGEDSSRRPQRPWRGVTSTGQWPLDARGETTEGSPPGRAEGQKGRLRWAVRKGTHQISLGGRERSQAGSQVPEGPGSVQDAPCGAQPAATEASAPCGLPEGCTPHPGAASSSAAPGLG